MEYHPVDFDIDDFLARTQGNKPPFICPAETCQKVHKSFAHIQKHMLIHRPPAPIDIPASPSDLVQSTTAPYGLSASPSNGYSLTHRGVRNSSSASHTNHLSTISHTDSCAVVFGPSSITHGQTFRCSIYVPLTFRLEPIRKTESAIKTETVNQSTNNTSQLDNNGKSSNRSRVKNRNGLMRTRDTNGYTEENCISQSQQQQHTNGMTELRLPQPVYEVDPEFVFKKPSLLVKEGHGYIRFIEKTLDELDEVVEYDLDEEDLFWLERINNERKLKGLMAVDETTLEWTIDRFEKEAKFRQLSSDEDGPLTHSIDEDAVCSICQDGSCENTNVILFCDVCNLAVHQECYGVPYVPEGPWLCRKCLHSPSEPVSCVLCPNTGGAFKKTSDDRWAHVICGLWVPEVMFANLTFLEPLEGIDRIAPARWRLQCFICKQRNAGACIQCHKTSCYRAFHVTCAQQAGLYMKIEDTDDPKEAGIRKNAFCDLHCPPDHFTKGNKGMYANSESENTHSPEQAARIQLRKARKALAERRNSKPSICVPIVPKAKIDLMCTMLADDISGDVMDFLGKAYAFWKLKREARRGVPLLKRLQACSIHRSAANFAMAATTGDGEAKQMRKQLQFWQQLRQDLEKARLLSELIRKRERVKRDIFRVFTTEAELQIKSINIFLLRLLEILQDLDKNGFFAEPVGPELAPDYHLIIKHPMDFATMRSKIEQSCYLSIKEFESDYNLMLNNCFQYNRRESIYYAAATRISEQGKQIFREAFAIAQRIGLSPHTGLLAVMEPHDASEELMNRLTPTEDTSQVKENCLFLPSHETEPVKALRVNSSRPSSPKPHSPLRELVNSHQTISVSSSTRSRVRRLSSDMSGLHPTSNQPDGLHPNAYLSPIELPTRRSRKRRLRTGSHYNSPTGLKASKQRKLDVNVPNKDSSAHTQSTITNFFAPKISKTPTISPKAKTITWPTTPASTASGLANSMNLFSSSSWEQTTPSGSSGLRLPDSVGSSRNGPAFTRYRVTRLPRYEEEEEEDEDDEDESSEEDSSDPVAQFKVSTPIAQPEGRLTRDRPVRNTRSDLDPSANRPLIFTTLVGKSHLASMSCRRAFRQPIGRGRNLYSKVRPSGPRSRGRKMEHQRRSLYAHKRKRVLRSRGGANANRNNETARTDWLASESHNADVHQPLHFREPNNTSTSLELSDACSQLESPGPLSASTSIEPGDFFNQSSDIQSVPGSPSTKRRSSELGAVDSLSDRHIGPLDVVWAKCRGSPWYPALVIDPGASDGYSHNGVPVPIPPESVLRWGRRITDGSNAVADEEKPNLLVLFFDTKRTWQWLSRYKLQPLGLCVDVDRERLRESRRSKMKNSVIKAYRRAVEHLCKVHGRPYPYSDGKSGELAVFTL
ncbi:Bromodomain and PHD finger-containing protein 1 [Clonorchis sinensis]|uniref:Bromodomain and PHD finger-containing protein 1 n=1 Tax=Clonorchis sinensis TaxID=79923 RepID=A0A3R7JZ53_CLOSI|nr:Bromodomain and PHD finger-containing protein 1 [Clonorchis sinensis]